MSSDDATLSERKPVNLRVPEKVRAVIDRAAAIEGTSRSEFMIAAAREAAERTILDQALVSVSAATYAAFVARLDAPPEPSPALRRTMATRPPWS